MQSEAQGKALHTSQWLRRNLKWIGILAFLFLAGLVLRRSGVGFSFLDEDEKQALKMVELFHERMNTGHFDEMYDDAHPVSTGCKQARMAPAHEGDSGRFRSIPVEEVSNSQCDYGPTGPGLRLL
jgi:hypothetical protein